MSEWDNIKVVLAEWEPNAPTFPYGIPANITGCGLCQPGSGCKPPLNHLNREEQEFWAKRGYWATNNMPFNLQKHLKKLNKQGV